VQVWHIIPGVDERTLATGLEMPCKEMQERRTACSTDLRKLGQRIQAETCSATARRAAVKVISQRQNVFQEPRQALGPRNLLARGRQAPKAGVEARRNGLQAICKEQGLKASP
jgi:hypothetical protein